MKRFGWVAALTIVGSISVDAAEPAPLPGTAPLTATGDLSAQMVEGIDRFLMKLTDESIAARAGKWKRDVSTPDAYTRSIETNRRRFREKVGAIDPRVEKPQLEILSRVSGRAALAENSAALVYGVRWRAFGNVSGEGLLIEPRQAVKAQVLCLPDADHSPESLVGSSPSDGPAPGTLQRLALAGCRILIPTLIDRQDTWSGNPAIGRLTNQPHREFIYRQAYEMGRHIIGYEVLKVESAVDALLAQSPDAPVGVMGYGEGGLVALYVAALDSRLRSTLVSGYFNSRQQVWSEPIYRNVFGLLEEFGDAEIASMIAPRRLTVEVCNAPTVDGPPKPRSGRGGAAPGKIVTPAVNSVEREVVRAGSFAPQESSNFLALVDSSGKPPFGVEAIQSFLKHLGITGIGKEGPGFEKLATDPGERQHRQFDELVEHTQKTLRLSEPVRRGHWNNVKVEPNLPRWSEEIKPLRAFFWEEVIGKLPAPNAPANPKTRLLFERPTLRCYEVTLDVWPGVYAWGYLLVPKNIAAGERRPVVVCQHGLEGVPGDTVDENPESVGYRYYHAFALRLAEQGFITYAPHNPYRGMDKFRVLQRKANPLKKSLFSVIIGQHDRLLDWLSTLPMVDPSRIGFYGLSYGGKSAMRIPAVLDRYCLSICSADFNEWIKKNVTVDSPYTYMFSGEYEMPEFNLGQTFNYAEMGGLIAPRPFMVERGHDDGVAPDEWVAYEFAKIQRLYAKLGIRGRTEIEYFNGPHSIHGVGTFQFLHRHLLWP